MDIENILDMNNPKIKDIVDTYRRISEVYEKIKSVTDRSKNEAPAYGITNGMIVSAVVDLSSTSIVRLYKSE